MAVSLNDPKALSATDSQEDEHFISSSSLTSVLDFRYAPLDLSTDTIRLLKVLPGPDNSTIECNLLHCTISELPSYTALSYSWDYSGLKIGINCNGKSLWIAWNLWCFLAQFRKGVKSSRCLLWIDAICINQKDVKERTHQVRQMRSIYSTAESVIVWLGQSDDYAGAKLASDILTGIELIRTHQRTPPSSLGSAFTVAHWNALLKPFQLPYWKRVWIIQEFILAKRVTICWNRFSTDLKNLEFLCETLQRTPTTGVMNQIWSDMLRTQAWVLTKHRMSWKAGNYTARESFRLRRLLRTYEQSVSTDIRDKIYGLLGLATDFKSDAHPLIPDYSLDPKQVFVDVIRNQCRWHTREAQMESLAFASLLRRTLGLSLRDTEEYVFNTVEDLESYIHIIAAGSRIFGLSSCISQVLQVDFLVGPAGLYSRKTFQSWRRQERNVFIDPDVLSKPAITKFLERIRDPEVSRILACNIEYEAKTDVDDWSRFHWDMQTRPPWTHKWPGIIKESSEEIRLSKETHGGSFTREISENITERFSMATQHAAKIFVGTDGMLGMTSSEVRPGDYVCVMRKDEDVESALLIREVTIDKRTTYRITGIAFFVRQAVNTDPFGVRGLDLTLSKPPKKEQPVYDPNRTRHDYRITFGNNDKHVFRPASPSPSIGFCHVFHTAYLSDLLSARLIGRNFVPRFEPWPNEPTDTDYHRFCRTRLRETERTIVLT